MTRLYDEERLGVLLRLLRPAPPAGCGPRRSSRPHAARSTRSWLGPRRIVAFRDGTRSPTSSGRSRREGYEPEPSGPSPSSEGATRTAEGRVPPRERRGGAQVGRRPVGAARLEPAQGRGRPDRAARASGPSGSRASGRSEARPGKGVRVCILDSGVDASHPRVGELESAVAISLGENDEIDRRRGHGGRRLRSRNRVRRHRPTARTRGEHLERPRARRELHAARAPSSSPASATRSSRASTSST